ncbi:MAG: primosomal protein N' [Planctomycetes bacterium]|jgi:primosomal protein N' (replication factor Y)|nr:primosomal protein N' [Planctomycetota bacterium]MBT6451695.1 primosomal protein N' [Planctomycetota bacterium]MBT6540964.1 primosomal protein N' [Planctomycetota bacterium]MBT6784601.1 primosomal protein N' [Planctomycetota bacterium]MBT6968035.1 primosomal protein N' [Planctomycetota bacterium]
MTSIARVALPIPLREPFDYRIPSSLVDQVRPGVQVRVPFGPSKRIGWVVEITDHSPHPKLRDLDSVIPDSAAIEPDLLELLNWTADYYLCGIGEVIECAVPKSVRNRKVRTVRWVRLTTEDVAEKPAGATGEPQQKVLDHLRQQDHPIPLRRLVESCDISDSPVKTLARRGVIEIFDALPPEFGIPGSAGKPLESTLITPPFEPNPQQCDAIAAISATLENPKYRTFLLHGVTGSGKTEVYIRTVQQALDQGRGALVLLPEIALTPQAVERFTERLGPVAVLHSMLPDSERAVHYERLRRGEVRIALGARSAVFAPVPDLGIIIVDESHESTYKQENSPRYHARDVAVMRAHQLGVPCVLGSATPSLESLENARTGRYQKLLLSERTNGRPLATVEVVDRRIEKKSVGGGGLLSQRLIERIRTTLDRKEQVLLFLNRRGFARNLHCPSCGHDLRCHQCDIPLTYHKSKARSQCNYCGEHKPIPGRCPECQFHGMQQRSPGTERIEDSLLKLFPGVEIDRLDRDTVTSAKRMASILQRFKEGKTQILVGTQMVAKGHDIPGVTLVGVLDADIALGLPDFRSAERTAQLLCQVAGRAGRGDRPGRVILQTRQPEHYALSCATRQDLGQLLEEENSIRKLLRYPPHGHLARILCEDEEEQKAYESAKVLVEAMKECGLDSVQILGPAPAPIERLRGRFRQHLLLKSLHRGPLREVASTALNTKPRWASTRITLDIDPQNLL